jgi:hypothetical protein
MLAIGSLERGTCFAGALYLRLCFFVLVRDLLKLLFQAIALGLRRFEFVL